MLRTLALLAAPLALAACQAPYSESELTRLDAASLPAARVRLEPIRIDRDSALDGARLAWIHSFERLDGTPDVDTRPEPDEGVKEMARKAFQEQLAASGLALAGPDEAADYVLAAEIRRLELRTEVGPRTGVEGRRSAVAEVRFTLRRASDSALLSESAESAWTVFSGADLRIESNGRRIFQSTPPEPRTYAFRAALHQFLTAALGGAD